MYNHWPEAAEFQPHCEEHLRKWVLCKTGHCKVVQTLQAPRSSNPAFMAAMMKFAETLLGMENRFGRWKGSTLAVYEAKSISFHKLGQADFNKLNDEVEAVYESETGLKVEQVLKEQGKAA
jgi:hypothetical protein